MIQYDPHYWRDHFFDLAGSTAKEIYPRVLVVTLWAALVVAVHKYAGFSIAVPSTLHALVGVPLGLLLVFRTNASYDRFWEGRKLWGSIVNTTRNLCIGAKAALRDDLALHRRLTLWTISFPYATMFHLRGQKEMGPLAALLPRGEDSIVEREAHVPLAVSRKITGCLDDARRRGLISDYLYGTLQQHVYSLNDSLGGCERIHRTPLPFAYVVHLRRALVIYCGTLPFALVDTFGWGTVFDVLLVTYTFFGIEEIGVEIEDPFGEDANDLPLDGMCKTIEDNLRAISDSDW